MNVEPDEAIASAREPAPEPVVTRPQALPSRVNSPASSLARERASPGDAMGSRSAPPAAPADDAAWIHAAVEQFEVPLTQYVTRLLRGDVERARDVVQDAFLKLWTQERDAIEGHLGQWLYRVCRNRALDVRRKESRMTALQDEQLDVIGRHPAASAHDAGASDRTKPPPETPTAEPHGPAVIAMLNTLNESQQEALRLKFQGGLSYKEIAAVMDITSNHVGVLIHHAIKALREHMLAQQQRPHAGRVQM